jgi:hypothetical protein
MWDSYNTGFVTIFVQNSTISWSYIQQANVVAGNWISSPITIGATANYHVKFTPVTSTGASLWPDQIINLTHTGVAPTLFLIGNANPLVELWWFFFDAGAYWDDGITSSIDDIVVSGTVNTSQLWVYPITYDYSDSFGNASTQAIRTVTVQDTTAPEITVSSGQNINIEFGTSYTDAGATVSDNSTGTVFEISGSGAVDTMTLWTYTIYYEYVDPSGNTWSAVRLVTVQDTTAPVITLIGDPVINIPYNGTFSDSWADWTDMVDGSGIQYTSDFVPNIVWEHIVTYMHRDTAGNDSTIISRTVNVIDATIPTITLNGSWVITIEAGGAYIDSGATYNDDVAGAGSITASGTVNMVVPGSYLLTYNYADPSGNTWVQQTRTVIVQDTTVPLITISGPTNMIVAQWWVYYESWAMWSDIVDGTWSAIMSGTVNTSIPWIYYIDYSYTDLAGNTGTTQTRTVTVTDQTAPLVSLNGSSSMTMLRNASYIEWWAIWTDTIDGSWTIINPTSWSVSTWVIGTYVLTYSHSDNAGNTGSVTRTVNVVWGNTPTIILNGSGIITQEIYLGYVELWAIYYDTEDGTWLVSTISWSVNTALTGSYLITYGYTDTQGNTATQITVCAPGSELTTSWTNLSCTLCGAGSANTMTWGSCDICPINTFAIHQWSYSCAPCPSGYTNTTGSMSCVDTTAPVITLVGSGNITMSQWSSYLESWVTWTDTADWYWSIMVPFSWTINTWVAGVYNLYYRKIDTAGNISNIITRTINIVSNTSPIVQQSVGGWGSSSIAMPPTISPLIKEQIHSSAPIVTTLSHSDDTKNLTPSSNQAISIKIGKDGRIIIIKTWDNDLHTNQKTFAKDLAKQWVISTESTSNTWDASGTPIILKKYWIITSEMLRNPRMLKNYQPTWDAAPRISRRIIQTVSITP